MNTRIIDVSGDAIIAAALTAAIRSHQVGSTTKVDDVVKATGLGGQQAGNALAMANNLRLLSESGDVPGAYRYSGNGKLRLAPKPALPSFFRESLQQYPPFLVFLSLISREFSEVEAARQTCATFGIGLDPNRVRRVMVGWGMYAGILRKDGALDFTPAEVLELGFLRRLSDALKADISIKTFLINELGPALVATLYEAGVDLAPLSSAIAEHESSPKDALRDAGDVLEYYLASLAKTVPGPVSQLIPMADSLSSGSNKVILRTHKNLVYGMAGFRNAASHGSDPDTGTPWGVSPEAALVGSLVALLALKSIARYVDDGAQEI